MPFCFTTTSSEAVGYDSDAKSGLCCVVASVKKRGSLKTENENLHLFSALRGGRFSKRAGEDRMTLTSFAKVSPTS
jgi:hypothetical protein